MNEIAWGIGIAGIALGVGLFRIGMGIEELGDYIVRAVYEYKIDIVKRSW